MTGYSNGQLNGSCDLGSYERKPAYRSLSIDEDPPQSEYTKPEAGSLDFLYSLDRSAASVEEALRAYFGSNVSASDQMGDWPVDYRVPRKRRRPEHRYWMVDRDKVESWLKLAGQAVFVAAIAALAMSLIVGLFG